MGSSQGANRMPGMLPIGTTYGIRRATAGDKDTHTGCPVSGHHNLIRLQPEVALLSVGRRLARKIG